MHDFALYFCRMKICHLSVLNPATHTRIFAKLARSQAQLGHTVSVVAQHSAKVSLVEDGVHIHPVAPFHRLGIRRMWESLLGIFLRARRIDAEVYVIHSPELLPTAWLLYRFLGKKIIYDVHEDYAANIQMAIYYPTWLRQPLARGVRWLEIKSVSWLAAISYAELCYDNMLHVPSQKKFFLQNKVIAPPITTTSLQPYALLSGTIAPERGLWDALALWEKLYTEFPMPLYIVGHTHRSDIVQQLRHRIAASPWADQIFLIGGSDYVPHHEVLSWIAGCTYGFALYRAGEFRQAIIPTKFYEYMAYQKPLIFSAEAHWLGLQQQWHFGVAYTENTAEIVTALRTWLAAPPIRSTSDWSWEAEVPIMEQMLNSVR